MSKEITGILVGSNPNETQTLYQNHQLQDKARFAPAIEMGDAPGTDDLLIPSPCERHVRLEYVDSDRKRAISPPRGVIESVGKMTATDTRYGGLDNPAHAQPWWGE